MTPTYTFLRGRFSLKEARLCSRVEGSEEPQSQEKVNPIQNANEKKRQELRGSLLDLKREMEFQTAKEETHQRLGENRVVAEGRMIANLLNFTDQELMKETGVSGMKDLLAQVLKDPLSEDRTKLLNALVKMETGKTLNVFGIEVNADVSMDNLQGKLLKFAGDVAGNEKVSNILQALNDRGVKINVSQVTHLLFTAMRAFAANRLSLMSIPFLEGTELMALARERGKELHYRMALESHARAEIKRVPSLSSDIGGNVVTATTAVLQEVLGLPERQIQVKNQWDLLYKEWSETMIAIRKNGSQAPSFRVPGIADASAIDKTNEYLAALRKLLPQPGNSSENVNGQKQNRVIGGLTFEPGKDIEVKQETIKVDINNKNIRFNSPNKGSNSVQLGEMIYALMLADGSGQKDAIVVKLHPSPNDNAGDIEVVLVTGTENVKAKLSDIEKLMSGNTDITKKKIVVSADGKVELKA